MGECLPCGRMLTRSVSLGRDDWRTMRADQVLGERPLNPWEDLLQGAAGRNGIAGPDFNRILPSEGRDVSWQGESREAT